MPKHSAQIGSVSSGTMLPEDLLSAFTSELEWIGDESNAELIAEANALLETEEDNRGPGWEDDTTAIVDELFDALNEHAPAYCYFGAHEGDGADYGFWPSWDSIDELPKFNDLADVPDDIAEDFTVVNDHGNVSIYGADRQLIWDCV